MKRTYPFLDGLRAIAIVMVFYEHIHHFLIDQWKPVNDPWLGKTYFFLQQNWHIDIGPFLFWFNDIITQSSTGQGVLGVDLFFMLSGFLITRLLLGDCSGEIQIKRFYARRFWKIYPSYLVLICSTFAYIVFYRDDHADVLGKLPIYLTFLQNWKGDTIDAFGHTWSIIMEEQFYLFYPLIALVIFKIFPSANLRRRILLALIGAAILIAPIAHLIYKFEIRAFVTLYHFHVIALGCILGLLEHHLDNVRHKKPLGILLWLTGIGLYIYLMFMYDWQRGWPNWYVYNLSSLAAVCIVVAGLWNVSLLSRIKWLQWFGRHSYGTYLWHYVILFFFVSIKHTMPLPAVIILYVITASLAGILSTRFIERPFLNLREKIVP